MRSIYYTIPNSLLPDGITNLLNPIRINVELKIPSEIKTLQTIIQNNCGHPDRLSSATTLLSNLTSAIVNHKNRLSTIITSLNLKQDYEINTLGQIEINQKNEFLLQSAITNSAALVFIEQLQESIQSLEKLLYSLDLELSSCITTMTGDIPSLPPIKEVPILVENRLVVIDLEKVFSLFSKKDIIGLAKIVFYDTVLLSEFLKQNRSRRISFANRLFLTLEQASVIAYVAGIRIGRTKEDLLSKLNISYDTVLSYVGDTNLNNLPRPKTSSGTVSEEAISKEEYVFNGKKYLLTIFKVNRYKLAPVFQGIATDENNKVTTRTNETFSNSPLVLLSELKYKIRNNIS